MKSKRSLSVIARVWEPTDGAGLCDSSGATITRLMIATTKRDLMCALFRLQQYFILLRSPLVCFSFGTKMAAEHHQSVTCFGRRLDQPHAAQKISVTRIGAQILKPRIDLKVHQPHVPLIVSTVEKGKRLVFFSETRVNGRRVQVGTWSRITPRAYLPNSFLPVTWRPRGTVRPAARFRLLGASSCLGRFDLRFRHRFIEPSGLFQGKDQERARHWKRRVRVQYFLILS